MKRTAAAVLVLLLTVLTFTACAARQECEADSALEALGKAEDVTVCVYADMDSYEDETGGDTKKLPVLESGEGVAGLLGGKWEKCSGDSLGNKLLSLTLSTQYEICIFDSGKAMVYYGYCGIFEKDRQYYEVSLDSDIDQVLEYVRDNCKTVQESE